MSGTWLDFKEEVYGVVKQDGPVTTDEVTEAVSRSANPTYGALKHLTWDDRIVRDSDGGDDVWYVDGKT